MVWVGRLGILGVWAFLGDWVRMGGGWLGGIGVFEGTVRGRGYVGKEVVD